jgi:hypothetical protein
MRRARPCVVMGTLARCLWETSCFFFNPSRYSHR